MAILTSSNSRTFANPPGPSEENASPFFIEFYRYSFQDVFFESLDDEDWPDDRTGVVQNYVDADATTIQRVSRDADVDATYGFDLIYTGAFDYTSADPTGTVTEITYTRFYTGIGPAPVDDLTASWTLSGLNLDVTLFQQGLGSEDLLAQILSGDDTLSGTDGGDLLNGYAGADSMSGGLGNDLYFVDDPADTVVEAAGEGDADRIATSVSYTLAEGAEVELITTRSSGGLNALTLIGNSLAQTITGNAGNNLLGDGGVGAGDVLRGLAGNDVYIVNDSGTQIIEAAGQGTDRVATNFDFALNDGAVVELLTTTAIGGDSDRSLTGNSLSQTIIGNAGNNVLNDGSNGASTSSSDIMRGMGGNDIYFVYDSGDQIIEFSSEGANDRIAAGVDYNLANGVYVELITTTSIAGTDALSLIGNSFTQTIIGNAGNNVLSDGGNTSASFASDTLRGLGGSDTYIVYDSGTMIVEGAGDGTNDRVAAAVDFTLAANDFVELLTTSSTGSTDAIDLTGNQLDQTVLGNAGDNRLEGGFGNDILRGLGGDDIFVFADAVGSGNVDIIADFTRADDQIMLDQSIFSAIVQAPGQMLSGYFKANTSGVATDANDRIVYDTTDGRLFYDFNGDAAGGRKLVAILSGAPSLGSQDFDIV